MIFANLRWHNVLMSTKLMIRAGERLLIIFECNSRKLVKLFCRRPCLCEKSKVIWKLMPITLNACAYDNARLPRHILRHSLQASPRADAMPRRSIRSIWIIYSGGLRCIYRQCMATLAADFSVGSNTTYHAILRVVCQYVLRGGGGLATSLGFG